MSLGRVILWCATLGALGLVLRSVLDAPPPPVFAVAALVAYLATLVVLTLVPQLEAFGDYLCRVPQARGLVALTFDDGPDPKTTPRVLEILEARGQRGTFFVLGWKVEKYPDIVRQIHERGHQLALHGHHHDRLYSFKTPASVQKDVERCQAAVERASGVRPVLFRPPIGQASPRTFAGALRAGVALVGWSVRPADGLSWTSSEKILSHMTQKLEEGAIVLLHDATERGSEIDSREPPSLAVLPRLCDLVAERGLRSVTLEELIRVGTGSSRQDPARSAPCEAAR